MILLVPISPEVPRFQRPKFVPSLLLFLIVAFGFIEASDLVDADQIYTQSVQSMLSEQVLDAEGLKREANLYLKERPLLKIAPAKGDWDYRRLLMANFVHGSLSHLGLNLIGVFAGARILSTFIPFLAMLSIFIVGGSLGLYVSMWLTPQLSDFIPHVGASAGIFAMMGAYYVYNFHYRTRYFFWVPTRRGFISLKTSTFFFVDVILMELVLSTAQVFPNRPDGVDHIAHVVGFLCGLSLAFTLRMLQRWPSFLHTRSEFLYWLKFRKAGEGTPAQRRYRLWIELLQINRYNDQLKLRLCRLIESKPNEFTDLQLDAVFHFLNPTFIRLYSAPSANLIRALMLESKKLPHRWLKRTPYDSIIRIARFYGAQDEDHALLVDFITEYRKVQESGDIHKKLEGLLGKLNGVLKPAVAGENRNSGT